MQYESYLPGYHSMRDLNEDSHGCSWPLYYSEKACQSGQYYNGILPRATSDAYLGCDRDAVKRTMLEHEAIFKNQVTFVPCVSFNLHVMLTLFFEFLFIFCHQAGS